MRESDGADHGVGDIGQVAELSNGADVGVVAANGHAEIDGIGNDDRGSAQLLPGEPVVTGVAGELVAGAAEAEPGLGLDMALAPMAVRASKKEPLRLGVAKTAAKRLPALRSSRAMRPALA